MRHNWTLLRHVGLCPVSALRQAVRGSHGDSLNDLYGAAGLRHSDELEAGRREEGLSLRRRALLAAVQHQHVYVHPHARRQRLLIPSAGVHSMRTR